MSRHVTFLQRYLLEGADARSIAEAIAEWKQSESSVPVHEYLGLTRAEYDLYERDQQFFFDYLKRTRAIKTGGCG